MDAQLKQVSIKPATFDKESVLVNEGYATLTLNIPMDSAEQRQAIIDLMDILSAEWCFLEIEAKQIKLPLEKTA